MDDHEDSAAKRAARQKSQAEWNEAVESLATAQAAIGAVTGKSVTQVTLALELRDLLLRARSLATP
jgi:hypothetical protein